MQTKVCKACGLEFSWRKKWEKDWGEVKYCSKRCQKMIKQKSHLMLESFVRKELQTREQNSSFCPSDFVRKFDPEGWRFRMEEVRCVLRRLRDEGAVEILQRGKVVDERNFKGPIRARRKAGSSIEKTQ